MYFRRYSQARSLIIIQYLFPLNYSSITVSFLIDLRVFMTVYMMQLPEK
jgi:hypothetical protein